MGNIVSSIAGIWFTLDLFRLGLSLLLFPLAGRRNRDWTKDFNGETWVDTEHASGRGRLRTSIFVVAVTVA